MARELSDEEVFGSQPSAPVPTGTDRELTDEEIFGKPKDLSLSEVATGAIKSAPGSVLEFGKALIQPIIHPIETATSLKNLGMGVAQKLGIAAPGEEEKYADALGEYFKKRYGGLENIKRTFATDPVGFLADASTVFTGGGALAAKMPGVVGQIGQGVRAVGSAVDPLAATARGIGAAGQKLMAVPTETVQAAERLGVQIPAAAASESSLVPRVAGALKEVPVAGYPLAAGSQRALTQLENAVDNFVQQLGSGRAADAGDLVRQSTEAWVRGNGGVSGQILDRLYKPVDNLVSPLYYQPLNATTQAVVDIMSRRSQARIGGTSKAVDEVMAAVQNPSGINYPGLKDLRTYVGNLMGDKNRLVAQNIDAGEMKRIYGALSDDLKSVVQNAGGPDALKAFERANNTARLVTNRRAELQRLLGVTADASAEQIIQRVADMASGKAAKGNLERLEMLKKSIPRDTWNEMSSAIINKMGRAAEDAPFSGTRFVTAYESMSDKGRQVLFGSTPWVRQSVDDIYQVSQAHKRLMSFGNPSGTGRVATLLGSAAGLAKDPISTIGSMIGGAALAQLLATPVGARSVTAWGRAYEAALALPSPGNLNRLDAATRALYLATEAEKRAETPRRATGGSVLDPMKKKPVPKAPPTWTTTNPVWNALNPYQKAAAMALMEADKGNLQDARNALGAMINRAARSKQDLGSHVSQRIYQPSIEPTQQARLSGILKNPAFQQLTGWAERRAQGYEPDPVNGATHFLAPEKTMLALQQKNPDKYHNWGPFKNTAGRPGKNWSRYNPQTGQYENVVTRDESHAFVAPEGRYSVPYRGTTEGAPATAYDQDAMAKLIADAEKREGMDRLVSDVNRPQNVRSLASDQEARQSLDKAVESATGPSSAQKDQLSKYIQGLMAPQPQAPMPLIQGPPIQATPISPVTPYDVPRADGGSVLAKFRKNRP